jgi:class 3 adenylate cyclase
MPTVERNEPAVSRVVRGIRVDVVNTRPDIDTAHVFRRADAVIGLVERYQPWRVRHLRRDLAMILVQRFACRGAYFPDVRACLLELTFMVNPGFSDAQVAATLVHEGMHARLDRFCEHFGVPPFPHRRARHERICRRAELEWGLAVPGGDAVVQRALESLALADEEVAPEVDWREANRRVAQGDFSVRVPVASTDESGELARSFNEMVAGLEERERLREAFGAYVDPELAERVRREGTDLAGEEVDVSVLFMDIRDFTGYAEQASAREVVTRLNELYDEVVPVITNCGGHASKFIGDGLLAVFGAPERLEDHADRAVAAATEIPKVVQKKFGDELRVGVGVNSGPVMSGTIGGGGRLDFTVIGDVVNTASRVEGATRDTGDDVLITEATRSLLSDNSTHWEDRSALELKGKSEEVRLFAPA